jgi:hypothetical protein
MKYFIVWNGDVNAKYEQDDNHLPDIPGDSSCN